MFKNIMSKRCLNCEEVKNLAEDLLIEKQSRTETEERFKAQISYLFGQLSSIQRHYTMNQYVIIALSVIASITIFSVAAIVLLK